MELVIVERCFAEPATAADAEACLLAEQGSTGLQHGWIAGDGRHAVHLYAVSDPASLSQIPAPPGVQVRTWAGAWVPPSPFAPLPPPPGFSLVVVQREFPRPVSVPEVHAMKESAEGCNQTYGVIGRDTFLAHGGCNAICTFFAPDAEAVRTAQRQNNVPFVRAWSARPHA